MPRQQKRCIEFENPCSSKKKSYHQHWNCITHKCTPNQTEPNQTEQHNLNLIRQKISHSCHTKYDLQRQRWQQRSKWNISFGDEMKKEHSAGSQQAKAKGIKSHCIGTTNIYVLIECRREMASCNATTSITEPHSQYSLHCVCNRALTRWIVIAVRERVEAQQKRQTLKNEIQWWNKKNSHNFLQFFWFFVRDFGYYCVHKFLMLTAPLSHYSNSYMVRPPNRIDATCDLSFLSFVLVLSTIIIINDFVYLCRMNRSAVLPFQMLLFYFRSVWRFARSAESSCCVLTHLWFHQFEFNDIRVESNTYW